VIVVDKMALISAGDLITDDGQLEFNGYLLGDNEKTFLDTINGWDDLPGIDSGNTLRANAHGGWSGKKLAGMRTITWDGRFAPPPERWEEEIRQLRSSLTIPEGAEESPIVIRSHGEKKMAYGALTARALPMDRAYGYYGAKMALKFECSDPRRYSLEEHVWNLQMPPVVSVGLVYPLTYPLDYGEEVTSSVGNLVNDGDILTPITIVMNGPMFNPAIINQTTGVRLQFNINLSADEFLQIDTRVGTVFLNGIADRLYTRSAISAPILSFGLVPGDNQIQLTASSWGSNASATIIWRDATL